jgi:hypothetical protein
MSTIDEKVGNSSDKPIVSKRDKFLSEVYVFGIGCILAGASGSLVLEQLHLGNYKAAAIWAGATALVSIGISGSYKDVIKRYDQK